MTSPTDVATFYAEYDVHPDDRVGLFGAVTPLVANDAAVLYPGSYVDIAPSVWFDDVTYVDMDKRAPRFFGETEAVAALVTAKRKSAGRKPVGRPVIAFHHDDYRNELPVADGSIDLLISLYAGFISEPCARYLRPGGLLLVNGSHGDAAMAALDPAKQLVAVITSRSGAYKLVDKDLDTYMQPKKGQPPTADGLRKSGRGIAYTKPAMAYLFKQG